MRWQIALAVVGFILVAALLAVQAPPEPESTPPDRSTPAAVSPLPVADDDDLCFGEGPAPGGTLREGMVGAPQYPNPLLADANPVDAAIVALLFDGLTRYNNAGELTPALAESWTVSDDGRTVRFLLRDARWHDGQPVTATDVATSYGLMQDPAFPGDPALHQLWQSVGIAVVGDRAIEFSLPQSYSPFLEATTRGIMPAHLLEGVTASGLPAAAFNARPIGTGPMRVAEGNRWVRDGVLRLEANPDVWEWALDALELRFYGDVDALIDAYARGEIEAMTSVSAEALPTVAALPGMRLYTSTQPRYAQLLFNVNEFEPRITSDRNVREAIALSLDRQALIDEALDGQALILDGPYLPTSLAYRPGVTAFAPDTDTADALLDASGWEWFPGTPQRTQVDDEFGSELPLLLRLLASSAPDHVALGQAMASQLRRVGIGAQLQILAGDVYRAALAERDFDMALVDVRPPADPDLYDFWSQEAIIRGQNYAGWNERRASELLEEARMVWPPEDRAARYDGFLSFYDRDVPAFTLLQYTTSYGLSEGVASAEIGLISQPRDRYTTLPQWTINTDIVPVPCPTP